MTIRQFFIACAVTVLTISGCSTSTAKPEKSALLVIDIQNCFIPPAGTLPVPDGDQTIDVANKMMAKKGTVFDTVIATQDYHPPGHISFASSHDGGVPYEEITVWYGKQTLWFDHCIENTTDAEFPKALNIDGFDQIVQKGREKNLDSYSGFLANDKKTRTALLAELQKQNIKKVYVMGLALDFCVNATALDAIAFGFETYLILDGSRGVNIPLETDGGTDLPAHTGEQAIAGMRAAGVHIVNSTDL